MCLTLCLLLHNNTPSGANVGFEKGSYMVDESGVLEVCVVVESGNTTCPVFFGFSFIVMTVGDSAGMGSLSIVIGI